MNEPRMTVSEDGKLDIPVFIGKEMTIDLGDDLTARVEGNKIILKQTNIPSLEEFKAGLEEARAWAASKGLTEADVEKAIREVRQERRKKVVSYDERR